MRPAHLPTQDRIDTLNAADPRNVTVRGIDTPYELAYAGWLTVWAKRLARAADNEAGALGPLVFTEEMRIVARGQHVRRWLLPRSSYPEGREGYLKWRNDLKKMHAETVTEIMREEGYFEDQIATVRARVHACALQASVVHLCFARSRLCEWRGGQKWEKGWGALTLPLSAGALQHPSVPCQHIFLHAYLRSSPSY